MTTLDIVLAVTAGVVVIVAVTLWDLLSKAEQQILYWQGEHEHCQQRMATAETTTASLQRQVERQAAETDDLRGRLAAVQDYSDVIGPIFPEIADKFRVATGAHPHWCAKAEMDRTEKP